MSFTFQNLPQTNRYCFHVSYMYFNVALDSEQLLSEELLLILISTMSFLHPLVQCYVMLQHSFVILVMIANIAPISTSDSLCTLFLHVCDK